MNPQIIVLAGGQGDEREISLSSGAEVGAVLKASGRGQLFILDGNRIPDDLKSDEVILFPLLHGAYGEDGEFQNEAENRGFAYVGSDAESNRRCFDKMETRTIAETVGLSIASAWSFSAGSLSETLTTIDPSSGPWFLKPRSSGSSVGLKKIIELDEIPTLVSEKPDIEWMLECTIKGFDLTVGVLNGKALGTVGIFPASGTYDYFHKYTSGATRYDSPANISKDLEVRLLSAAESVFTACGCRDFARVDFIVSSEAEFSFLEVNTLPGMTQTSLLPKAAQQSGLSFEQLIEAMVQPALSRFKKRHLSL